MSTTSAERRRRSLLAALDREMRRTLSVAEELREQFIEPDTNDQDIRRGLAFLQDHADKLVTMVRQADTKSADR